MRKLLILMLVLGMASWAVATPTIVGSATINILTSYTETYQVMGSAADASTNGVPATGGWSGIVWIDYALYPALSPSDITAVSAATTEMGSFYMIDTTTYPAYAIRFAAAPDPTTWTEDNDVDAALWFSFDLTAPVGALVGDTYLIDLLDLSFVDQGASLLVTVVPEPMTMVLLGLGGLFLRRRK